MTVIRHDRFWSAQATSVSTSFVDPEFTLGHTIGFVLANAMGSVQIQGRPSADHAWQNIRYVQLYDYLEGTSALRVSDITNAPIVLNGTVDTLYFKLVDPFPQIQAVLQISAGTITGEWWAQENDNFFPGIVRLALGDVMAVKLDSWSVDLLESIDGSLKKLLRGQAEHMWDDTDAIQSMESELEGEVA